MAVGDGVGDADPGQPRRGGGVDKEANERKAARKQERRANEREGGGPALMEP